MHYRRWSWWAWALACLVGVAALAAIILAAWKLPSLLYGDVSQASPDARLQAASGFRTAFVAGLAGLAALGSLAMASRTYRLTQQGQITDRYTKAIEQLGSDKLDVRLGGIYALVVRSGSSWGLVMRWRGRPFWPGDAGAR
jgi:membrane protein implicated in regulation of membrane protease activity